MRRFAWWQVVITLVVGPFGVGMVGSALVSIVLAMVRVRGVDWGALGTDAGALTDFQRALVAETASFPVVATSLAITALGFAGGPMVAAHLRRVDIAETLGLRRRPAWLALLAAPVGILALGPLSDTLVELARRFAPNATLGALAQIEAIARSAPWYVLLPFLALCPGFSEEILFRGFVQRSIGRGALAITVSALTFALIHMDPHHVIGVIPLGFYLAWIAARTDSTWISIAAHVANNAAAVISFAFHRAGPARHATPVEVVSGLVLCAAAVAVIARVSPPIVDDTGHTGHTGHTGNTP